MKDTHQYIIRLDGHLSDTGARAFKGHDLSPLPSGQTMISTSGLDQAALFGLLIRVRDMGIPLLSVIRRDAESADSLSAD